MTEHALPAEIQALPDDETVCKFCGVSYLIHREVKRLQVRAIPINASLFYFNPPFSFKLVGDDTSKY